MKALNIIESGYRATLEEQDDTIVWFNHAMKGGGADLALLLRGNAVNYAVKGQDASGLSFGQEKQTQPPQLAEDLVKIIEKGVPVHIVEEDVAERGLERSDLINGLKPISKTQVAKLVAEFDQVWHW
ncbi:MAG: DsrE family protein [bacterium]|nr:DsrE family protein [bacterium]